jgi:hypothetical protein
LKGSRVAIHELVSCLLTLWLVFLIVQATLAVALWRTALASLKAIAIQLQTFCFFAIANNFFLLTQDIACIAEANTNLVTERQNFSSCSFS